LKHVQIDRTKWIRGEMDGVLYRPSDDKSCCVGLVCAALGVSKTDMAHVRTVEVLVSGNIQAPSELTIENAKSHDCECARCGSSVPSFSEHFTLSELYSTNDSDKLNDTERESKLIPLFVSLGIAVEFIN